MSATLLVSPVTRLLAVDVKGRPRRLFGLTASSLAPLAGTPVVDAPTCAVLSVDTVRRKMSRTPLVSVGSKVVASDVNTIRLPLAVDVGVTAHVVALRARTAGADELIASRR